MQNDDIGIAIGELKEHVRADNAEVQVTGSQLADYVRGPLEPDLEIRDLLDLSDILPRVDLVYRQSTLLPRRR